jgi:hypothetical protein
MEKKERKEILRQLRLIKERIRQEVKQKKSTVKKMT